jgi:signal transduction histidine kinase/ligand-binding sensor domain-containing protein
MRTPRLLGPACRLAALALAWAPATRADEAPPPSEYFTRNWLVDQGVPHNSVNRVVQDSRGYLWLATEAGLARFDGRSFREFALPAASLDYGYNIRALAIADPAALVMLPAGGGVLRLRDGVFSPHPVNRWVGGRSLVELFPEPSGALWLGTADGDLVRWMDGRATTFGRAEGVNRRGANFSFAIDGTGHTWIAGGEFLCQYDRGRLIPFPQKLGSGLLIAPSRSGGLWISTADKLWKWDRAGLVAYSPAPLWPFPTSAIQQMYEDSRGVLWIASRRYGLYRFVHGQLVHQPTSSQILTSVIEDAEGDIWVTSDGGGISEIRRKTFVTIDASDGLLDGTSSSVCVDSAGVIWCADRGGGVAQYAGGRAEIVPGPREAEPFYANTVCSGKAGDIWVGAVSGLYRISAKLPRQIEPAAPQLRDVHLLFCARDGDLWVASGNRLGYFQNDTYHPLAAAEGFSGQKRPSAIAQDPSGTIWVAVDRELFVLAGGRLVRRVAREQFPGGHIHALDIAADGEIWIGTARGLVLMRGGLLRCFLTTDGLEDNLITQVLEDGRGRLWLGGRRGFFHVAIRDLQAVADGRATTVVSTPFGTDEGLVGAAPISVCQPAVWRAADGRLWFATYLGVVGLDPAEATLARPAPPVFLDQVLVDNRASVPAADLRVPSGNHSLQFLILAPSFIAPEKVQLRHRLIGYDTDWIDSGSERLARYSWLPPGRYVLQVAARHWDGVWGPAAAIQTINVVPTWWQTWWGRSGALLVFTGLVIFVARYLSQRKLKLRLRRLEQEHALEKERARIARNLHDELGTGLSQLGMLAHRLKRRCRWPELGLGLGQLAAKTRRLASELESIVWTVSPKNDSLASFAVFLIRFAYDFFEDTDIACIVRGAEAIPPCVLAPDIQHQLLAVTKEALNNALKYSGASQIIITLCFLRGRFELSIADNGAGFSPDAAEHAERNGLSNMRARIQEIGGQLRIESSPQRGTVLTIRVPMTDIRSPIPPAVS